MPAVLAGALSVVGLVPLGAPASAFSLYARAAGPVDNATGYPFWFEDNTGTRLELCLDDPVMCPVVGDRPSPADPPSVPENFPDESFWWVGEALIDAPVRARLVLAQEAAFGGPGDVAVGQQVAFSRLRVRIDDLLPGETYHVTTPYGDRDVVADDTGRVFETEDVGCLSPPCDFSAGLNGQIGPFLRWDSGAPAGFMGDPNIAHTVTGSPTGQNLFRVEGPDIGGPGVDSIETDLFTVQGRLAQPRGTVDLPGDLYVTGTPITLTSSFPGESTIYYTVDESDPATSPTRKVYDAPYLLLAGSTTLKYAVEHNGQLSEVYTEQYTARDDLSSVSATPGPAVAPAVLEGRQDVALTATTKVVAADGSVTETPTVGDIYYTTDGTRPRLDAAGSPLGSTKEYADPIKIARTTMVKAISVPDGGEAGPVGRFHYVIRNLRAVSTEKPYGYPFTLTDIGLPGATPADARVDPVELELCLDDPLCPVVGELPDPTRGISFPDNFPDESFWWSGDAEFTATNGIDARLVLASEAAFDSLAVQDDHQVAFGRIRVRLRDAVPLATYEIVHPYGVVRAEADDRGRLFYTDDNGCMNGPCGDFNRLLTQPVGPFLRWDTGAPQGYVGDGATPHTVVGSPYGTNEFTVTQVTDGDGNALDEPVDIGSTDLFAVQGKLAGPGVVANWQTGTFNHALDVTLTGNSLTTEIRYTTDGTDPSVNGQVYTGPIHIGEGNTSLRYVGIGGGQTSTMEEELYTIDATAPTVSASPAGGTFTAAQDVTLGTNDPTATIRFTTDGSDPRGATAQTVANGGSVRVASSLTLRAVATDLVGNVSDLGSWTFTIGTPTTGGNPGTGGGTTTTPPPTGGTAVTGLLLQQGTVGPVNAGSTTTLSGVLAVDGQAVGGAPVVLQARPLTTTGRALAAPAWVDVATTTTAADGSYVFARLEPKATTDYRVVFRGDAVHAPTVSATQRVQVRAVVTLSRPDRRVERGDRVTFRGHFGPTVRGATVVVKLDGPGSRTDKVRATVDSTGKWKATLRAPRKTGKWTVVAVWRGEASLLADSSVTRTMRVVR